MKHLIWVSVFLATMLVTSSRAVPLKQSTVSDSAVNTCLFACAMCFDNAKHDDLLMTCANQLCLGALQRGKPLNPYFSKYCPMLKVAWKSM